MCLAFVFSRVTFLSKVLAVILCHDLLLTTLSLSPLNQLIQLKKQIIRGIIMSKKEKKNHKNNS